MKKLNFLHGVLHDDLADRLKEILTGEQRALSAKDFDDMLPRLTAGLDHGIKD